MTDDNIEDDNSEFDEENLEELEEEVEEVEEELNKAEEELEREIENNEFDEENEEEAPGFADVSSEDDDEEDEEEFDKPVSEGETVEIEVEDLGSKGDGIARVEGFVVFVPGGEVGKSYDVEITSVGRKFAFAEIEEEV